MINILKILLLVVLPYVFVVSFTKIIMKLAIHVDAIDYPNARKVHNTPIPRLGGLAIYASFLFGLIIFNKFDIDINAILIGSFIIIILGFIDDIKPISALTKFLGQLVVSMIIVFYGHIFLSNIHIFGLNIDFSFFKYPITIFFILGSINSMNLIDGLDGLASLIALIYFITISIIALFLKQYDFTLYISLIMTGSILGFLKYNFYPAKIFMGDTGSMFLGYIIAIITLLGYKTVMMSTLVIPLVLLIIPISDTFFAIVRRLIRGENIAHADKCHIHHQLLRRNFTHKQTVLIIALITFLFAIATLIYVLINNIIGCIIYIILIVILAIFLSKTDIIFK